eukprot:TRINITY_DN94570_c0_g1_i1.p1 TRINITY_DN94570_c0_g1~~TRINITY_DN94570_c0_g1_i1.p1  ORF type:complete len:336 (+),score=35.66 TRINITY_DN94570_c0_g1_i1:80-1087(+)
MAGRKVWRLPAVLFVLLRWTLWSSCPPGPCSAVPPCARTSVVLVTSPVASHPSTQLIDEVIHSFKIVSGLADCPLVIVGDGVTVRSGRPRWNQGKVDEEHLLRYTQYLDALRSKYETSPANVSCQRTVKVVGPLPKRVNFAHALLEGLRHVDTELVLVAQHDRVFEQPLDLAEVLPWFDKHPEVRYIGFQTVNDYPTYAVSKYGGWARAKEAASGSCLLPLFMWYDSAHICRTQQLAKLIEKEVRPGEFIESSYGCRLLEEIRSHSAEWNFEYHMRHFGLFLFHDAKIGLTAPIVRHMSGRTFLTEAERLRRGWPGQRPVVVRGKSQHKQKKACP